MLCSSSCHAYLVHFFCFMVIIFVFVFHSSKFQSAPVTHGSMSHCSLGQTTELHAGKRRRQKYTEQISHCAIAFLPVFPGHNGSEEGDLTQNTLLSTTTFLPSVKGGGKNYSVTCKHSSPASTWTTTTVLTSKSEQAPDDLVIPESIQRAPIKVRLSWFCYE